MTAPPIDWGALAPLLIVLGAACVGVLVEAFLPRHQRWPVQVGLSVAALGAGRSHARALAGSEPAGITRSATRSPSTGRRCSSGARSLALGLGSVLLIADRSVEPGGAFVASAASRAAAGGSGESPTTRPTRTARTAPGPGADDADRGLPADAVRPRRHDDVRRGERPADHVRRARGAQPAAVPDLRAGPAPPAAVAGGGGQVLPARRVRLGVLPLRPGAALRRTPAACGSPTSRARRPARPRSDTLLFGGLALLVVGLLFKGIVGAVPHLDAGRLPGRADAGHRVHGRLHQGRRVRRDPAGAHVAFGATRWTWRPVCYGPSPSSRWWSAPSSASPRPTSSGCWPTPRSRTPGSC